jgi:four helix bundle protein
VNERELLNRTKQFALRVIRLADSLPRTRTAMVIAGQLVRSGTSVGANYRAACKGRSKREFVAKLGLVEEEADETAFWLELVMEALLLPVARVGPLHGEAIELSKIMARSRRTASAAFNGKSKIANSK